MGKEGLEGLEKRRKGKKNSEVSKVTVFCDYIHRKNPPKKMYVSK